MISIWGIGFVVVFVLYDLAAIGMTGLIGAVSAFRSVAEGKLTKAQGVGVCPFTVCFLRGYRRLYFVVHTLGRAEGGGKRSLRAVRQSVSGRELSKLAALCRLLLSLAEGAQMGRRPG